MESRLKKRGRPALKPIEKHLFLSDFQIPEHDIQAVSAILKFIPDFKPDVVHFVGDILDLTKQSSFTPNPHDKHTLMDEITIARDLLTQFRKLAPKARLMMYEGNHEKRMIDSISRRIPDIADLLEDGDYVLSLPRLLQLKRMEIQWVPYYKHHTERGSITVEHGDVARSKAGLTGHAMMDRRGSSGVSGHTHRLALVYRTQGNTERFWIENGSLCKRDFSSPYLKLPDWIQGFSVGTVIDGTMHPQIIPIINHSFIYGGKVYAG